jgi:hypothetical protein
MAHDGTFSQRHNEIGGSQGNVPQKLKKTCFILDYNKNQGFTWLNITK